MKRSIVLIVVAILLSACSLPDLSYLLPAVPPTPTATSSPTATLAPGETPLPTETATSTETPTDTPVPDSPTPNFTAAPSKRPTITLPPSGYNLSTPRSPIFASITTSGSLIRWGGCNGPTEIVFTVRVARTQGLYYVLLFMRLQDKYSSLGTDWGGGAIMNANESKTVYTYTVTKDNISRYRDFDEAWLQYQIVATDRSRKVLGRSLVYPDQINLVHCATPTPRP